MTTVAQLTFEMAANVARLRTDMEAAHNTVKGATARMAKEFDRLKTLAGGVFAGIGAQAAIGKLVSVQREFDVLTSSLETVTGSSMAAEQEMRWIKEFATQTPYQLGQVTGAFVKMKALGLDASQKALASYGNTASAMGKDLNQMIEAVADAATGEFERLKEFGIKARKNGDEVAFTFRGVTTTVKNNAQEITTYLQRIGDVEFAGAMTRRMNTLDGAVSNLADTWEDLLRTILDSGVGSAIESSVRGGTTALGALAQAIKDSRVELTVLGGALAGAGLLATLPRVATGLLAVAGAVKAMGLALAANPLVLALLGVGAGAGALIAYNNTKNSTVEGLRKQIQLIEQAEAVSRRSNLNAETAEALRIKRQQQLISLKQKLAELEGPTSVASGDVLLRRAQADLPAASGGGKTPAAAEIRAAASKAKKEEADALRQVIDIAEYRNRLFDEEFDKQERDRLKTEDRIRTARQMAEAIEQETALLGMNANQREVTVAMLELERQGITEGTDAYKLRERVLDAILAKQVQQAVIAQRKAADERKAAEEQDNLRRTKALADSIEEGLLTGFRNGQSLAALFLTELKAQFAKTVLRPVIQPIAEAGNALFSGLFGGLLKSILPGLPSYDVGTAYVPRDQLAMVHKGERIIPASQNKPGAGGGQTIVVHQNFTVGDVASISMVRQAVAGSEARIAAQFSRSQKYGGAAA